MAKSKQVRKVLKNEKNIFVKCFSWPELEQFFENEQIEAKENEGENDAVGLRVKIYNLNKFQSHNKENIGGEISEVSELMADMSFGFGGEEFDILLGRKVIF